MQRCECGRPTRRIVERHKKSERVHIPFRTSGHRKGMIYLWPSHMAKDGLCTRCVKGGPFNG